MARGELIGLMDCPECGFVEAEVRPDKSGHAYRFCPDCTAQYFSRGGEKEKALLAKVRRSTEPPIVAADVPVALSSENATETPAAPPGPAKPKRVAFDLGAL